MPTQVKFTPNQSEETVGKHLALALQERETPLKVLQLLLRTSLCRERDLFAGAELPVDI